MEERQSGEKIPSTIGKSNKENYEEIEHYGKVKTREEDGKEEEEEEEEEDEDDEEEEEEDRQITAGSNLDAILNESLIHLITSKLDQNIIHKLKQKLDQKRITR